MTKKLEEERHFPCPVFSFEYIKCWRIYRLLRSYKVVI